MWKYLRLYTILKLLKHYLKIYYYKLQKLHHLPLAISECLVLVYGFVWEPFDPGAGPKCLKASLLLGPLSKTVLVP